MTQLHAPDAMGEAAHNAAMHASGLDFRLLSAASPSVDRTARADALRKALEQWPALCRAMSELQAAAPNIYRQAQAYADGIKDFVEHRS